MIFYIAFLLALPFILIALSQVLSNESTSIGWIYKDNGLSRSILKFTYKINQFEKYNFSQGGLKKIPSSIFVFSQLKELYLFSNKIQSLPIDIVKLKELEVLDLGYNQLENLPFTIGELNKLTHFKLSNNKLTTLPRSIKNLSQLRQLDLSQNELTEFPESITSLSQLNDLSLSGNQLEQIPESISQILQLRSLRLSKNNLVKLPESIGEFTQLRNLYLDKNRLLHLPESITKLPLYNLYLSGNKLKTLPSSIPYFKDLTILDVSDNELEELPEKITDLDCLFELKLSQNKLTELPKNIGKLSSLGRLDLSKNKLKELPESIQDNSRLKYLDISDNEFRHIPTIIGFLSELETLRLSINKYLEDLLKDLERKNIISENEKLHINEILDSNKENVISLEGEALYSLKKTLRKKHELKYSFKKKTAELTEKYIKKITSDSGYTLYQKARRLKDPQLFYQTGEKYDHSYNAINGDVIFSGCSKEEFAFNCGMSIDYLDDFEEILCAMQLSLVFSCHCYFRTLSIQPRHYMANLKLATALTAALRVPYAKVFWRRSLQLDPQGTTRALMSDARGPGLKGFASKAIFLELQEKIDPQYLNAVNMVLGNTLITNSFSSSNFNPDLFAEQLERSEEIFQVDSYVTKKLQQIKEKYDIKDFGEGIN